MQETITRLRKGIILNSVGPRFNILKQDSFLEIRNNTLSKEIIFLKVRSMFLKRDKLSLTKK